MPACSGRMEIAMAKMTSGELKRKILRRLGGEKKGMSMDALASALRIRKGDRPGFLLALGRLEQKTKC